MLRFHILNRFTGQTIGQWVTLRKGARSIVSPNVPILGVEIAEFAEMLANGSTCRYGASKCYLIETTEQTNEAN